MIRFLLKKICKNTDINHLDNRGKVCMLAGILGIICNFLLFILKFLIGFSMKSIAIISDAFNNLSDMGSSLITIIGTKLSQKKPDKEHPFGHGRYEYIASLIVSFIIIMVGVELFKTSVAKIFKPESVKLSPWLLGFLCLSLPVKLWMYSYNNYIGKTIKSNIIIAAAKDNLNDVVATGAVVVTSIIGVFVGIKQLDGIVGTIVSLMIIYSGFGITVDTIGLLLGSPPSAEITQRIRDMVLESNSVVGVHDLIVHDYGPGRIIASVHAEVPDNCNVVEIHEVIDELEHRIYDELGIHIVIHMDPISVDCEYTSKTKVEIQKIVKSIDENMNIHDFRIVDGTNNVNLIFDVEIPADYDKVKFLKEEIQKRAMKIDSRFNIVMNIDIIYS